MTGETPEVRSDKRKPRQIIGIFEIIEIIEIFKIIEIIEIVENIKELHKTSILLETLFIY